MTETNLQEIISLVSDVYHVQQEHVLTKCRIQPLPEARAVICYIASRYTNETQETIAKAIGMKRANVSIQRDKIGDWRPTYSELDDKITRVEEYLDRPNLEPLFIMAAVLGGYED